jgi:hypothetical protein
MRGVRRFLFGAALGIGLGYALMLIFSPATRREAEHRR